jgi:hypothetical protein
MTPPVTNRYLIYIVKKKISLFLPSQDSGRSLPFEKNEKTFSNRLLSMILFCPSLFFDDLVSTGNIQVQDPWKYGDIHADTLCCSLTVHNQLTPPGTGRVELTPETWRLAVEAFGSTPDLSWRAVIEALERFPDTFLPCTHEPDRRPCLRSELLFRLGLLWKSPSCVVVNRQLARQFLNSFERQENRPSPPR